MLGHEAGIRNHDGPKRRQRAHGGVKGLRNDGSRQNEHLHVRRARVTSDSQVDQQAIDRLFESCALIAVVEVLPQVRTQALGATPGQAAINEDGAERRNVVSDCVAMKVRDPGSDRLKEHDDDASGFWLVNPDNWIERNSASDCDGQGLWNSFATECFGMSRNVELSPNALGIASFDDNVAHSCGILGMLTGEVVIDEAGNVLDRYYEHDEGDAVLRRNIAWKNRMGGYRNRVRKPNYVAWTCADNSGVDIFGAVREESTVSSPLMIGTSQNNATPFDDPLRRAFKSYHFALDLVDVTAVNYPFVAGQLDSGDMFTAANTFVSGGGVLDSSDLYLDPITMQMERCRKQLADFGRA